MLFDTEIEAFQIAMPIIAATATISALLIIVTIKIALKVGKNRVMMGINSLIGESGQALTDFEGEGQVRVGAEIWHAVCGAPLKKGDTVNVESVQGLILHVVKKEGERYV